jgi:hypothetical protein
MWPLETESAARDLVHRSGGIEIGISSEGTVPANYSSFGRSATDFAASVVAARFHLSPCMARLVCELASIGGRLA